MPEVKINNTTENDVHVYRRGIESFEARSGLPGNQVDTRGTGEEKQFFARVDEALTAAELRAQNSALEARLAKLESQPVLEARAPRAGTQDESELWLRAMLRGDRAAIRTMGTVTAAASGSQLAVDSAGNAPTDMERRIREKMYQASIMRQLGVVNTIDSKRTLLVENALPTAALVSEHYTISAADPTLSTVSVTPYKFAAATKMTQEFIEDAIGQGGIGTALDYVAGRCGIALGREMEKYFQRGTNSSQPQGIMPYASSAWTAASGTTSVSLGAGGVGNSFADDASYDFLLDVLHSVAPQYRASPRFSWVMHDNILKTIRKLKDGNGQYIWSAAPAATQTIVPGLPGTILGYQYRLGEFLQDTPTTTTDSNAILVCGDFNYFEIFDRIGVQTVVDPYSAASAMATTVYVYARTDSKITLGAAFATAVV